MSYDSDDECGCYNCRNGEYFCMDAMCKCEKLNINMCSGNCECEHDICYFCDVQNEFIDDINVEIMPDCAIIEHVDTVFDHCYTIDDLISKSEELYNKLVSLKKNNYEMCQKKENDLIIYKNDLTSTKSDMLSKKK